MSNGACTITATAYDAAGNHSAQSITVTVKNATTTPPATQRPGMPVNVRLTAQPTGAMLNWMPGVGGTPASYTVLVCRYTSNGLTLVKTLSVTAPTTSTRITVPTTGTYYLHVCAVNTAGASTYSPWIYGRIVAGL
jgi:predicted phage tail protein